MRKTESPTEGKDKSKRPLNEQENHNHIKCTCPNRTL